MPKIEKAQLASALAEAIQTALIEGDELHAPGFGVFRVHHESSQVQHTADGNLLMKPPRDFVTFSPEPH